MPVKLNVGLSKKVGLPSYGSLGASCHVETDLDGSLWDGDLESFQRRVRRAFAACAQAVQEELQRQQTVPGHANALNSEPPAAANGTHAIGTAAKVLRRPAQDRPATQPQLRVIASLVQKRKLDLHMLLVERFHNPEPTALSVSEASRLIDELRSDGD